MILWVVPSRSSPKFPHPIFFPTRKFGPTIMTPDPEPELLLGECRLPLLGFETFLSRSRSLSLSRLDCISRTTEMLLGPTKQPIHCLNSRPILSRKLHETIHRVLRKPLHLTLTFIRWKRF